MNNAENKGEIVIYQSADGTVNLDARLENETIWLTQKGMAELFGVKTLLRSILIIFIRNRSFLWTQLFPFWK